MSPAEPGYSAFAVAAAFALGLIIGPLFRRLSEGGDRRRAIELHRQNWSHGQIGNALGRDPRQIARWLSEADRNGST